MTRVQSTRTVSNLMGGQIHLQMAGVSMPPAPVLVVHRAQLLGGAQLSDLSRMVVTTVKMALVLIDVSRVSAGGYFDVEPGSYAVPSNLGADGIDDGLEIHTDLTTASALPTAKLTAVWNASGRYYEAK